MDNLCVYKKLNKWQCSVLLNVSRDDAVSWEHYVNVYLSDYVRGRLDLWALLCMKLF